MTRMKVFVLLAAFTVLFSGCQKQESDPVIRTAENTYYSSYSVMLDLQGEAHLKTAFTINDHICASCFCYDNGKEIYSIRLLDKTDGKIVSSQDITLGYTASFCCKTGDNKIVYSNGTDYTIIDPYTGEVCAEGMIPDVTDEGIHPIDECGNGFVFVTQDKIYKISSDGNIIDSMELDVEGYPCDRNAFFEQNGHEYLVTEVESGAGLNYYELDFAARKAMLITTEKALGVNDAHGQYSFDAYWTGELYRLDIKDSTKKLCAYKKNMLMKPAAGIQSDWFVLNEDELVTGSEVGPGTVEVTVVHRNDSLNLGDRTVLTIAGDNAVSDTGLAMAAYQYNMAQDKYLVNVEDWGNDYRWNTAAEAEMRNLRLIKRLQDGNAPDIIYGDNIDLNSFGKMGLVIDLMPYIGKSSVINRDGLNDHLYDLMTKNGKCYQLFNGYSLEGFLGQQLTGDCSGMDFYTNDSNQANLMFRYSSVDLLDYMLGYPLANLASSDGFISDEQAAEAVRLSTTLGLSSQEVPSDVVMADESITVRYGSFGSVNSLLQAGKNGSFVYYGFPSYGGSTYCIAPVGLTAISASSKNPDACFEFLEYLYSYETQMAVLSSGRFPMNDDVYNKYIDSMMNPGAIAADDHLMRMFAAALGGQMVSPGFKDSLNIAVNSVNMVKCIDFSVYKILTNEVNSYYQHGKTPEEVGASLRSRLKVYVDENYT